MFSTTVLFLTWEIFESELNKQCKMRMHEAVDMDPDGGQLLLVLTGAGSWLCEWWPWRFCCFLCISFANGFYPISHFSLSFHLLLSYSSFLEFLFSRFSHMMLISGYTSHDGV